MNRFAVRVGLGILLIVFGYFAVSRIVVISKDKSSDLGSPSDNSQPSLASKVESNSTKKSDLNPGIDPSKSPGEDNEHAPATMPHPRNGADGSTPYYSEQQQKERFDKPSEYPTGNEQKQTWTVDAQGISGAMSESLSEVNECYSAWLAAEKNKTMTGAIQIAFTIEANPSDLSKGKITEAHVVSTQLDHKLL